MSVEVRIGNSIHIIPEVGNNKWGEVTTDVLLALVDALSDVVGPEDIVTKEALLANGRSERTPINGLRYDTSVVQSAITTAVVVRTFPEELGLNARKDIIVIEGTSYRGQFDYSVRYTGNDAGVKIFAKDDGQFEYLSEDVEFTDSIFIKFRGTAIIDTDSED